MQTSRTILGQRFAYPEGEAVITAAIVTVPPHAKLQANVQILVLYAGAEGTPNITLSEF